MLTLPALPALPAEGELRGQEHGDPPGTAPAGAAASARSRAQPALHWLTQPKGTATKTTVGSPPAPLPKELRTRRTLAWRTAIAHPSCPRGKSIGGEQPCPLWAGD